MRSRGTPPVSVRLDGDRLDDLARRRGVDRATLLREAIDRLLEREGEQAA
jgi:predicted transcriptional regulator